jgi:hypothetical protein
MDMRKLFILAGLMLALAAQPAFAQKGLPDRFGDWIGETVVGVFAADAPKPAVVPDNNILREYGAESVQHRAYRHGNVTLNLTLYRMHDSTAGYGAYTFLQDDQMTPSNVAPHSSVSRQRALLLVGNLLVEVTGADMHSARPALKELASQLVSQADASPYPTLGSYLPAAGLVRNSERYLLGPLALARTLPLAQVDWVGFRNGAEAELARYRANGQEATLILISYPTQQIAAHQTELLTRWFTINPAEVSSVGPPAIFLRRSSSLVAIVAQTKARALADSLLEKIHHESEITWNEPHQTLTDPTWATVIVNTFIGTGILMLFAVIAGIGFGGVRLIVKYLFPGKVFDRPEHLQILQLGLSSKPIEAKDFY